MKSKKYFVLLVVALMSVILVACGGGSNDTGTNADENDTDSENQNESAEVEGNENAELEGSVVIDGSGTVYPLMAILAEEYMINEQEGVSVEVSRAGTGAGFQRFLAENGTDFNDASREIKEEEQQLADELGMEVKELKVALDGLTFVINPENDWATELTQEDVVQMFLADGGIEKWSDINPDFPDTEVNRYGPNENHGTYEFFFDEVLEKQDLVDGVNLQQDYSTLVNLIAEDPNGIAFFGFGYYVNNQDKLQAVSIDFGEGAVAPSLDTIGEEADYAPFTRPVFTYLNVDNAKSKPEVLDFAKYVMNHINDFAGETGFAPIPDEEAQEFIDYLEGL
ncbi:PstS family phosphate ABC transporter substrate-binding protein [Alkalihalobacillus sp. 1P02AB]|uniref:PstS family phosphate ABC transporter substrate-binding protein n=1 Tax=Alkalihalobacillus sp. 1P02AB TaxID=3132260 RepID=UPI0039A721E4